MKFREVINDLIGGGYTEYGNFENCSFNSDLKWEILRLVIWKISDRNFEFNFEKVKFKNVVRNYAYNLITEPVRCFKFPTIWQILIGC